MLPNYSVFERRLRRSLLYSPVLQWIGCYPVSPTSNLEDQFNFELFFSLSDERSLSGRSGMSTSDYVCRILRLHIKCIRCRRCTPHCQARAQVFHRLPCQDTLLSSAYRPASPKDWLPYPARRNRSHLRVNENGIKVHTLTALSSRKRVFASYPLRPRRR